MPAALNWERSVLAGIPISAANSVTVLFAIYLYLPYVVTLILHPSKTRALP